MLAALANYTEGWNRIGIGNWCICNTIIIYIGIGIGITQSARVQCLGDCAMGRAIRLVCAGVGLKKCGSE